MQPALFLPADSFRSGEYVPLNLEWESLDDQSPLPERTRLGRMLKGVYCTIPLTGAAARDLLLVL